MVQIDACLTGYPPISEEGHSMSTVVVNLQSLRSLNAELCLRDPISGHCCSYFILPPLAKLLIRKASHLTSTLMTQYKTYIYIFEKSDDLDKLCEETVSCIDEVMKWMRSNRLCFNPSRPSLVHHQKTMAASRQHIHSIWQQCQRCSINFCMQPWCIYQPITVKGQSHQHCDRQMHSITAPDKDNPTFFNA